MIISQEKLICAKKLAHNQTSKKIESRADTMTRIIKQASLQTQPATTPSPTKPREMTPNVEKKPEPTLVPTVPAEPVSTITPQTKTLQSLPTNAEEFTPEQEAFIDTFYTTYEKYFFVDDAVTYCRKTATISSQQMMTSLLAITNNAGYVLPRQSELTSFATDLTSACKDGTMSDKTATFKTRFDITYPY